VIDGYGQVVYGLQCLGTRFALGGVNKERAIHIVAVDSFGTGRDPTNGIAHLGEGMIPYLHACITGLYGAVSHVLYVAVVQVYHLEECVGTSVYVQTGEECVPVYLADVLHIGKEVAIYLTGIEIITGKAVGNQPSGVGIYRHHVVVFIGIERSQGTVLVGSVYIVAKGVQVFTFHVERQEAIIGRNYNNGIDHLHLIYIRYGRFPGPLQLDTGEGDNQVLDVMQRSLAIVAGDLLHMFLLMFERTGGKNDGKDTCKDVTSSYLHDTLFLFMLDIEDIAPSLSTGLF
jgi:hypothetical protein